MGQGKGRDARFFYKFSAPGRRRRRSPLLPLVEYSLSITAYLSLDQLH